MGTARTLVRAGAMATSIGLALLCAGCGGGKTGSSAGSSRPSGFESTPTLSRFQTFGQVPGPMLTFTPMTESGAGLKLDVKPMKVEWTAQFQSTPADQDKHFLVVYMAVTPTAKDRGFEGLTLADVNVRYSDPHGPSLQSCPWESNAPKFVRDYCYKQSTMPKSEMVPLASDWEHMEAWDPGAPGSSTNLAPGQAYAGIGVYAIPDNSPNSFDLCGWERGNTEVALSGKPPGPCVKLDTPPRA
jgi:hypothetical protein